jgi:hypothetical protein
MTSFHPIPFSQIYEKRRHNFRSKKRTKKEKVNIGWRKLHKEGLNLTLLFIKSRSIRWTGHIARVGEAGKEYRILIDKPCGKRPRVRFGTTCENHIKINVREIWSEKCELD